MTDEKCYVFNDGQNNALTTALLANGGGMNGAWSNPLWALIVLGFLGRNGFGNWGGGDGYQSQLSQIQDTLTTQNGNQLLMSAIQGNATSIKELASLIGCNYNAVQTAINAVQSAICGVGNQVGMTSAQVINAINNGNMSLANTLQSCCCDVKTLVQTQGYENRINNIEQSNMITKGFGDMAFGIQSQTTALAANQDANTRAVLAKIDAVEDSRKDREIASLTAALTAANSRAERANELTPIYQALNDIKCKQPQTVTLPYSCATAVPTSMVYGLYGAGQFGLNGGIFG